MEIGKFIENFALQFDETDISEFKLDSHFRDLEEWNSLTAMSIIAMIDDVYHVKLAGKDIRSAETIHDLFEILRFRIISVA
jgi:acyl carrier protein